MDPISLAATFARFVGGALTGGLPTPSLPPITQDPNSAISNYRILWRFYQQTSLYDDLVYLLNLQGVDHEALKALRCPAHRVVEFHAAKMFPGANLDEALPIVDVANEVVTESIHKVWKWSNWADLKQVYARKLTALGDGFIKVVAKTDDGGMLIRPPQVYLQLLDAETTTMIDQDNRGYLTYLRLDVPRVRRDAKGDQQSFWTTEVWDKKAGTFRLWDHEKGASTNLQELGRPRREQEIRQVVGGDDFIPVVQARFKNTGELRGQSAYGHALDKINEADRQATRLHQMLFRHNKNTFVAKSGLMGDNRPMPALRLQGQTSDGSRNTIQFDDEEFLSLPGGYDLDSLVPNINYAAALAILQDQMAEIEKDLPELKYYRLEEMGTQLSGRAVRLMLSDAVDVALEGRANAEAALIRANQMALSIGNAIGAFNVPGAFTEGSFDHAFKPRPVIPTDDLEDAQASLAEANAGIAWGELGVSKRQWLLDHGYSSADVDRMASEREADAEQLGSAMMDAFSKGQINLGNGATNGNGQN